MKKYLFIFALFLCGMAKAEGPLFQHKEPAVQQEFENIYQDLRNSLRKNGTVLQIKLCTVSATSATTTTSFVNSNLTCSITPSLITSTITISVFGELWSNSNFVGTTTAATLAKNGTNLLGSSGFAVAESQTAGLDSGIVPASLPEYPNVPATTSAVTYQVQIKVVSGTTTAQWCQANQTCGIILKEIQ